jgi:hypothetical protein
LVSKETLPLDNQNISVTNIQIYSSSNENQNNFRHNIKVFSVTSSDFGQKRTKFTSIFLYHILSPTEKYNSERVSFKFINSINTNHSNRS